MASVSRLRGLRACLTVAMVVASLLGILLPSHAVAQRASVPQHCQNAPTVQASAHRHHHVAEPSVRYMNHDDNVTEQNIPACCHTHCFGVTFPPVPFLEATVHKPLFASADFRQSGLTPLPLDRPPI